SVVSARRRIRPRIEGRDRSKSKPTSAQMLRSRSKELVGAMVPPRSCTIETSPLQAIRRSGSGVALPLRGASSIEAKVAQASPTTTGQCASGRRRRSPFATRRLAARLPRRPLLLRRRGRRRRNLAGGYRELTPGRNEVVHLVALIPEIDGRIWVDAAALVDDDAHDVELLLGLVRGRVELREWAPDQRERQPVERVPVGVHLRQRDAAAVRAREERVRRPLRERVLDTRRVRVGARGGR